MSRVLTIEDFQSLVGEVFQVSPAEQSNVEIPQAEIVLAEVNDTTDKLGRHALEFLPRVPFSLIFEGSPQTPLPQAYCRLTHPSMPPIEHLLVPVFDPRPEKRQYEMLFS